jgi:hypothetical protein
VIAATFVIAVSEQRQTALAGCAAQSYTSPPQSLEQARALAGLLLGASVAGTGPWRHPNRGRSAHDRASRDRSMSSPPVIAWVLWGVQAVAIAVFIPVLALGRLTGAGRAVCVLFATGLASVLLAWQLGPVAGRTVNHFGVVRSHQADPSGPRNSQGPKTPRKG